MGFFTKREREELDKLAEVEGEIRDFVRQREEEGVESQYVANKLAALINRVTGNSIQEIDSVTADLEALRGKLQDQGQHVQRQIADYATLSQSAMQSTKIMYDKLEEWRRSTSRADTNAESPTPDSVSPTDSAEA